MKKLMLILVGILISCSVYGADVKLLFRDYSLFGNEKEQDKVGALSLGVASWTDSDEDFKIGGYWDFKFLMLFEEKLNLGLGMVVAPPAEDAHYRMDARLETSLTTHLFNYLELGVWYAPFWSLAGKDDPYGVMIGYVFKF